MTTPRNNQQGTLNDLVRGLLDRDYTRVVQPVLRAIASSTNSGLIQQRLGELDAEAARLDAAGERMTASNPVLRALVADLEDTMRGNERLLDSVANDVQAGGVEAAGTIQRQLALPGMTDAQLAQIGVVWNSPDPNAVAALVDYVGGDAWQNLLRDQFSQTVIESIQNAAIRGIANGWGPRRLAREIRRLAEGMPAHVANTLARTLQLTSYRDGTALQQNANIELAESIIRIAARDDRTCLSCIAQHGDVIWDSETNAGQPIPRVNDHHNGRCTSVMQVRGRPVTVQPGADWFAGLPRERQLAIAGPGNLAALEDGAVGLRDYIHDYEDDVFGTMTREASLKQLLGPGASRYYGGGQ